MSRFVALASLLAVAAATDSAPIDPNPLNIPTMNIGKDKDGTDVLMPMAGMGTWLYNDSVIGQEIEAGLKIGARLIDTANMYGNEDGIAKSIKASGIPRDMLFLSTKVPGGLTTEATIAAHEQNLKLLGVETVDLLLTHYPCAFAVNATSKPANCSKADRQRTWKGLEAMYKAGKARAIGVSHYCQQHIEDILEIATVKISVNQEEWHVGMGPDPQGLVSFCKSHGISYQSFMPFCGECGKQAFDFLVKGDLVTKIGKAHNVSGSQVSLRWLTQNGSPVIPKSNNPKHIKDNLDLFSFELTDDEMATLNSQTSPASAEPVSADCKLPMEMSLLI